MPDDGLTIRIGADASGVVSGVRQATDALGKLQEAVQQQGKAAAASGSGFTAALKQGTELMNRQRAELVYLANATKAYGEEVAKQKLAWVQAAQGIDEYKARLQYLNAQLGVTNETIKQMGNSGPTSGLSRLGQMFRSVADGPIGGFTSKIMSALNPLSLFHSHVMRLVEVMGLWRLFESGSRFISNFVSQIAELPVTMERFQRSWTYTFGMSDPSVSSMPTDTQAQRNAQLAAAGTISKRLTAWSAQQSYYYPYTRQNMMQAISSLSMADLSEKGVEHYLPVLADLAATAGVGFGGQPVDLSTAAYAVQGAMHGMTRMLRYDLKINPDDLAKYGYDGSNPNMLLPALEAYTKAKGRAGAAKDMATNTFYGAKSSFDDRWQNFALDLGGYPAFGPEAGDLRKGSPFDVMRSGLVALNDYWDKHQDALNKIGGFVSETLGQGMKDAGAAFLAFADGVKQSGLGKMFGDGFMSLSRALTDPAFLKGIGDVARTLGGVAGDTIQNMGTAGARVGSGEADFWHTIGPEGRAGTINALRIPGTLYKMLGGGIGGQLKAFGHLVRGVIDVFQGNPGGSWGELGATWGEQIRPVGGLYDDALNFAGVDTHGAGQRNVDAFIAAAGNMAGAFNHWLVGGPAAPAPDAQPAPPAGPTVVRHEGRPTRTRLDMRPRPKPKTDRGALSNFGEWFFGTGDGSEDSGKAIGDFFGGAGKATGDFFGGVGNWFQGAGKATGDAIGGAGDWFNHIGPNANKAGDWLYDRATNVQRFTDFMNGIGVKIGDWFGSVASAIGDFFSGVVDSVKNFAFLVGAGVVAIGQGLSNVGTAIANWWKGASKSVGDWLGGIGKAIADWWHNASKSVGDWLGGVGKALGDWWKGTSKSVGDWLGGVGKAFTDFMTTIWNAVKNFGKWVLGWHVPDDPTKPGGNAGGGAGGGGHVTMRAMGGRMAAAGYSWVGEQGPELMWLPGGAEIYNAQQSAGLAASFGAGGGGGYGGGGGNTIIINGVGLHDILALIDLYGQTDERQGDLAARRAGGTRRFIG